MKKKLIFVCEFFLPEYIRRFNFSFFKKKGFDVYIVDLRYIVFPHYRKKINYSFKNFLFKYICIKKISDWNSLKSKLNNKYTFFWKHYYSLNFITLKISIDISKFFFFKTYNDNYTIDFKKKNLIFLKSFFNLKYLEFYLNFLKTFFFNTKIFFFLLFERILTKKKPFLFKLNHWDYNFFLHAKKNKKYNFKKKNYCIYIESTAPFYDGDYKFFKQKIYNTKKIFYNSINTFFNQIEKELDVQVLVFLHPKAIFLSNNYNYYGNRKIIKNKNVQVFKNCKFVMHRGSTAFSYAVFFNKPAIILISQEVIDKDIYTINYLNHFSKETGSKIVNINLKVKKKSLLKKLKINKKKYEVFKNKLVTFENKSNNNLLINYFNKKT